MNTSVNCPHCKKEVVWISESKYRPFCSERCRLQDLGAWFTEEHKISDAINEGADEILAKLQDKDFSGTDIN